jgi:hypothetical protein
VNTEPGRKSRHGRSKLFGRIFWGLKMKTNSRAPETNQKYVGVLKFIGTLILGAIIGSVITVPLTPWVARKLSKEPNVNVLVEPRRMFPGCTLYLVTVGDSETAEAKTFDAEMFFNGNIVSTGFVAGGEFGKDGSFNQNAQFNANPDCTVTVPGDQKLPDNVQASVLGVKRNELMISGHDISMHSMSTVIFTVANDPNATGSAYEFHGRATYNAFGLELDTDVNRLVRGSGKTPKNNHD